MERNDCFRLVILCEPAEVRGQNRVRLSGFQIVAWSVLRLGHLPVCVGLMGQQFPRGMNHGMAGFAKFQKGICWARDQGTHTHRMLMPDSPPHTHTHPPPPTHPPNHPRQHALMLCETVI